MRVLSIRQPYASLLVLGTKRIEARTWKTDYRGPILIHASSAAIGKSAIAQIEESREFFDCVSAVGWRTVEALQQLPRSAIVGQVNLVDVIPSLEYEPLTATDCELAAYPNEDIYFWCFDQRRAINPIDIAGKLNLWTLPVEMEPAVFDGLAASAKIAANWTNDVSDAGQPLRLKEFVLDERLQAVAGQRKLTQLELLAAVLEYGDDNALLTPKQMRLDARLAFLAPGKKMISLATLRDQLPNYTSPS